MAFAILIVAIVILMKGAKRPAETAQASSAQSVGNTSDLWSVGTEADHDPTLADAQRIVNV